MKTKYYLEIYDPEDEECIAGSFESETPFGALHVGEKIELLNYGNDVFEITKIIHFFWDLPNGGQTSHKIGVFIKPSSI